MEKRVKRNKILYVRIQGVNMEWVKKRMKALDYPPKKGRSEFVDTLITSLRNKTAPEKMRKHAGH
jgi:hypothetical protein